MRFIKLKAGCYFVNGPTGGAIYDLVDLNIHPMDEVMSSFLAYCSHGAPLDVALKLTRQSLCQEHFSLKEILTRYGHFIQPVNSPSVFPDMPVVSRMNSKKKMVWLKVTNTCNLNCVHCYAISNRQYSERSLSLDKWKEIINQLLELQYHRFVITGGEPSLRSDILPLMEYIVRKGGGINSFMTNGTNLSNPLLEFLRDKNIIVVITFHSFNEACHDRITCSEGSWQECVAGIKNALAFLGAEKTAINIPVSKLNKAYMAATETFLRKTGIHPALLQFSPVFPLGKGRDGNIVLPDRDPVQWCLNQDVFDVTVDSKGNLLYGTCWADKLLIMADGTVGLCPLAPHENLLLGSLVESSLKTIVASSRYKALVSSSLDDIHDCNQCGLRFGCRDCRVASMIDGGTFLPKKKECRYYVGAGEDEGRTEMEQVNWSKVRWRIKTGFLEKQIDDEIVLTSGVDRKVYLLNKTAAAIWELLPVHETFDDLVLTITSRYDLEQETAKKDIAKILYGLARLGVILIEEVETIDEQ